MLKMKCLVEPPCCLWRCHVHEPISHIALVAVFHKTIQTNYRNKIFIKYYTNLEIKWSNIRIKGIIVRKSLEINGKIHEIIGGQRLVIAVANLLVAVNTVVVQHIQ